MAYSTDFQFSVGACKATQKQTFPTDPSKKAVSWVKDLQGSIAQTIASTLANAAVGGGDRVLEGVLSVTQNSTATIDLNSFTDLRGLATQALARVKFVLFWLPSVAQDATIGTATTSVTIGNNGSNANKLFLGAQDQTFTIKNGGFHIHGDPSAAGIVVDGTHKIILVTNDDIDTDAKLAYMIVGGSS